MMIASDSFDPDCDKTDSIGCNSESQSFAAYRGEDRASIFDLRLADDKPVVARHSSSFGLRNAQVGLHSDA
jgi:hypothetical protein